MLTVAVLTVSMSTGFSPLMLIVSWPAAVIVEDTALVRDLPQEEHAGQDWWSRVVSSFSSSDDRSEPPKALSEPPTAAATTPVEAPAGEAPPAEKPPQ